MRREAFFFHFRVISLGTTLKGKNLHPLKVRIIFTDLPPLNVYPYPLRFYNTYIHVFWGLYLFYNFGVFPSFEQVTWQVAYLV